MWQVKVILTVEVRKAITGLYSLDEESLASGEKYGKMGFFIVTWLYLEMLTEVLSLKKKKWCWRKHVGTVLTPDKA